MRPHRWILAIATLSGLAAAVFTFQSAGPDRPGLDGVANHTREQATPVSSKAVSKWQDPSIKPTPPSAPTPVLEILPFIREAAISYDPKELPKIQPYLLHPEPHIRAAAFDGVMLLGDPAGSALLRQAASALKDPREAVKYLDGADYLELPSGSLLKGGKPSARKSAAQRTPSP